MNTVTTDDGHQPQDSPPEAGDRPTVRAGFMPLIDAAVLIVARERGFAAAEGLDLVLARETSWANIRDRLLVGHFDVAHMLAPMPIAAKLGIGHVRMPMIAPYVLALGGNSIAVSQPVWEAMCLAHGDEPAGPGDTSRAVAAVARSRRAAGAEPLTFAMTYPFSGHNYELRYWLAAGGLDPDVDVRLVVIPPPYMVDAMVAGQIDGMCVGAPWPSLAVENGIGRTVTTKAEIWKASPDKVLAARAAWAETHPHLIDALIRACEAATRWCADPAHHLDLADLLARPAYVGVPAEIIHRALTGRLKVAASGQWVDFPDYLQFPTDGGTAPATRHALWFAAQMLRWGQVPNAAEAYAAAHAVTRPDIWARALGRELPVPRLAPVDGEFFDGTAFDARDL